MEATIIINWIEESLPNFLIYPAGNYNLSSSTLLAQFDFAMVRGGSGTSYDQEYVPIQVR